MLREPALHTPLTADDCSTQAARAGSRHDDPPAALRRWKHRQIVRIAGRDLLGIADLRTVGAELAAVAQACLDAALAIADPAVPMAVIGMGKLGGCGAQLRERRRRRVRARRRQRRGRARGARAAARDDRADRRRHRLPHRRRPATRRPVGRAQPHDSTRTTAYWERWAQTWELQALIKARPVAGDADLGAGVRARGPSRTCGPTCSIPPPCTRSAR